MPIDAPTRLDYTRSSPLTLNSVLKSRIFGPPAGKEGGSRAQRLVLVGRTPPFYIRFEKAGPNPATGEQKDADDHQDRFGPVMDL